MTRAQMRKLETILTKLEALENEVKDADVRGSLGDGKSELLRALRKAGGSDY